MNGESLRSHAPFDVLITAPAKASSLELQAVVYLPDGRVWRTSPRHVQVVPDPGQSVSGRALGADGGPAVNAPIAVRANGLAAEYFRADEGLRGWSEFNRHPDKRGFVTAVNQPDTLAFVPTR